MKEDEGVVLPWLGSRDYLHGTTLFEALLDRVGGGPVEAICFKIARVIASDRIRVVPDARAAGAAASLTWRQDGQTRGLGVLPLSRTPSPRRRDYLEGLVTERVVAGDGSVELAAPSPFGLLATLVPMFKRLLAADHPAAPGQWMFVRLDLDRWPPGDWVRLRLTLVSLPRARLARARIGLDGRDLGDIYYSWVTPGGDPRSRA